LDMIRSGTFSPEAPDLFAPIAHSLLEGGDRYLVLADYRDYLACQDRVARAYRDQNAWTRMSILNTANLGEFSSDRTVCQYADEICGIAPVRQPRAPAPWRRAVHLARRHGAVHHAQALRCRAVAQVLDQLLLERLSEEPARVFWPDDYEIGTASRIRYN